MRRSNTVCQECGTVGGGDEKKLIAAVSNKTQITATLACLTVLQSLAAGLCGPLHIDSGNTNQHSSSWQR